MFKPNNTFINILILYIVGSDNMQIKLYNVNKSFYNLKEQTDVLKNINLEINKGEIVAIVGPSGCGKSTLLNLISGLIKQDSGEIFVKGKIGYMFQKDNLFEWRNVYKNITIGNEIAHIKTCENDVDNILKKYGLFDFKYYYPKELSGGMRQRVALIRTLILNPDILLLDEPFSSLDYQSKIVVQDDIYKIIINEKKTTILVTHDITEAIAIADFVYILSSRPSTIIKKIPIEFDIKKEEKTPLKTRDNYKFHEYFSSIWKIINS